MEPEPIEISLPDAAPADVESRLEHLAAMISGNRGDATLRNLRELYVSNDPTSTRFVENLLHCVACSAHWRCEQCDYRQAARERPDR